MSVDGITRRRDPTARRGSTAGRRWIAHGTVHLLRDRYRSLNTVFRVSLPQRSLCDSAAMSRTRSERPIIASDPDFPTDWAAVPRGDRIRLGRAVRAGRSDIADAALGVRYARFQVERPWMRWFWLWFLPGMVVAVSVASTLHPIAIGIVLAIGAQAVLKWRNLRRAARAPVRHPLGPTGTA
jgi:hypothetical protein